MKRTDVASLQQSKEFVIPTHLGAVNYGNNIGPDWSTGTGGIGGCTFGTLVVASDFPFNKMVAQTSGDNSGITYGWWITTVYIFDQALQRSNEIRKRQPPTT